MQSGQSGEAALADGGLELVARGEPMGGGLLDGGGDAQVGVGDELEVAVDDGGGRHDDPAEFHLGQGADLGQAAEDERVGEVERGERAGGDGGPGVIGEDLVGNEPEAIAREIGKPGEVGGGEEVAGGVIGVDEDDGGGGGIAGGGEGVAIEVPFATGVVESVGARGEAFGVDEELEQRVGGLGDEDGGAGGGDELEAVAVGFAGGGGEEDAIGREGGRELVVIIGADGLARGEGAGGGGGVGVGGEGGDRVGIGQGEAGLGGIGEREIGEGEPLGGERDAIGRGRPGIAMGEGKQGDGSYLKDSRSTSRR